VASSCGCALNEGALEAPRRAHGTLSRKVGLAEEQNKGGDRHSGFRPLSALPSFVATPRQCARDVPAIPALPLRLNSTRWSGIHRSHPRLRPEKLMSLARRQQDQIAAGDRAVGARGADGFAQRQLGIDGLGRRLRASSGDIPVALRHRNSPWQWWRRCQAAADRSRDVRILHGESQRGGLIAVQRAVAGRINQSALWRCHTCRCRRSPAVLLYIRRRARTIYGAAAVPTSERSKNPLDNRRPGPDCLHGRDDIARPAMKISRHLISVVTCCAHRGRWRLPVAAVERP